MTTPPDQVAVAKAREAAARYRLLATIDDLKNRVNPKILAREAANDLKIKGENAARSGVATIRTYPALFAGGTGAVLLLLARRRILGLFRRRPKPSKTSLV